MPTRTVLSARTAGERRPMDESSAGAGPSRAASGMPWTLPLVVVSGVFMSAWASTQSRPMSRPCRPATEAVAATDPAARL